MRQFKIILIPIVLLICQVTYNQDYSNRWTMGEKRMREVLIKSLTDSTLHNYISKKNILLKDKEKAVEFAENILFDIYGKDEIIDQKPYETYFIDDYWIIGGTLPKEYVGGTFLIIIDSRDYRIVRVTHGK